jgi:Skp family chaperone for outer membrane proteins
LTNESPFVSDSVYLFGNFSGRAQHIFKGISGEPELGDSTATVCLYSALDKWQLFTMRDYLSGGLEATKIDLYENNCSGDEDVFVALGSRLITGGLPPDFSVSYEELNRLDRNATLAVKEKFDVISEIFQDEVLKSERSGYGILSFDSSVSATCAVIQEDLSLHIDALNANSQVLQLFGDILQTVVKSENVVDAFRKIQRKECGNVYAAASDLVTLIEAAQNNQIEFEFLPLWVSNEAIAALAAEKTETEKARLSDEEARLQSATLQEQAEQALRQKALSEQSVLREKYEVRFSAVVDELTTATKTAVGFGFTHSPLDSNYVQEYLKLPILDAQDSSVSAFDPIIDDIQDLALEKWEQTGFLTEKMDYGVAVYNGRSLEGVIFDVKVELKNRLIGDFDTYCRTIRAVIDDDFDMWRNVEIDQCGLTGENWQLANSFESQWIVETSGQP